jgi:hypothetical protein
MEAGTIDLKASFIRMMATGGISCFNKNKPKEKIRSGLAICLNDIETGQNLLEMFIGQFSTLAKIETQINQSKRIAKLVSGPNAKRGSYKNGHGLLEGTFRGESCGIGVFGQELEENDLIAEVIVPIIEERSHLPRFLIFLWGHSEKYSCFAWRIYSIRKKILVCLKKLFGREYRD